MNILPNETNEFRTKDYWESFFKKRRGKAFEWYGTYCDLCTLLHKYIKKTDNILVIGCGNSKLSGEMYQVGLTKIINVDISEVVIKNMKKLHASSAPEMQWLQMDVTKMKFEDGQFAVVLDKGTLDALMTDDSANVTKTVDEMFGEIERVLKFGGRFICVSLLQEHILRKLLSWFLTRGWFVRVCRRVNDALTDEREGFPVFVVVCTKLKPITTGNSPIMLEIAVNSEEPAKCTLEVAAKLVKDLQSAAFLQNKIATSSIIGENVSLHLFKEKCDSPRYTLYVTDIEAKQAIKFAIFIVPNGRETEWLFGSLKGRESLAEMCKCQRLVVVHLNRDHCYENLDVIKEELSAKVMNLAPNNFNSDVKVNFLSVGDEIGKRKVLCRKFSEFNGELIVEDVQAEDNEMHRRLIFINSSNSIQSDGRLISAKSKKKRNKSKEDNLIVDVTFIASNHLYFMVAGLSFLPFDVFSIESPFRVLVVGLGGGSFPMFLHKAFKNCHVDVVELDPCVVEVAKEYFEFKPDERMSIEVADGLKFVASAPENFYNVLLIDVNNQDLKIGMSFPPKEFVEDDVLLKYYNILKPSGLLVLNLGCRDEQLKSEIISKINNTFKLCYSRPVPDQVNEIVYGLKQHTPQTIPKLVKENLVKLNKLIRSNIRNSTTLDEFNEIVKLFDNLNLLNVHDKTS